MAQDIEQWSIEKALACLKLIVHPDLLPSISQEELDHLNYFEMFQDNGKMLDFVKLIYKKSNGKLEIYGTVNEMVENFSKIDTVPEFVVFSSYPEIEVSSSCALLTPCVVYSEAIYKPVYSARSNLAINIYKSVTAVVETFKMNKLVLLFFGTWQIMHLNKTLRGLKGTYDFLPFDSGKPFLVDLDKFLKTKRNITPPKETITIEKFSELRRYFDPEDVKILEDALTLLKDENIASNQELFKMYHAEVVFLIENIKKIYERHTELFIPYAKPRAPYIHHKPAIRQFIGTLLRYYLAKEVNDLMKLLNKNQPNEGIMLDDMIVVESDEERKLGIVYGVQPNVFEKLLKTLNITSDSLAILQVSIEEDSQRMAVPIISSYGTHCISALDAFDRIIYYLAVIIKVFQRCKYDDLQEVLQWIDTIMFVEKSVFYLVEFCKIDEIIERARKDLTHFLTEPEYEIPFQLQYTRNDVFREFQKLQKNLRWENRHFLAAANYILNYMSRQAITFKMLHIGYSQMVRLYLNEHCPKVTRFLESQSSFIQLNVKETSSESKPSQAEPENKKFTGFKKGFLNKREDSSNKQEANQKAEEKSCSTENADGRVKELREEIKKLQKDKNRIEKQLEEEKARLKTAHENSENEIQHLLEKLEISRIVQAHCEKESESRISKFALGFREQVEKTRKELEKSQEDNNRLEQSLKTLKLNQLEETRLLNECQVKTDRELVLTKEDLGRKKAKILNLEDKSKLIEKEREDLKQKNEFLMSENEKLRADNFKNTQFQQKIKEHSKVLKDGHCDLVDIAWSRLHKMSSEYPDVEEAKNDVMKMGDCVDEYEENVKKEYEKLWDKIPENC